MLVQPLDDASAASLVTGKRCYQIGFGLADAMDERCRDRGATGAQNEPVTCRLECRADNGEIIEQIVSDIHISASVPGGTSPSGTSGIGPIGLIGVTIAAPSGPSVL
jgi:hypothetical protein